MTVRDNQATSSSLPSNSHNGSIEGLKLLLDLIRERKCKKTEQEQVQTTLFLGWSCCWSKN